MRRCPFPAAPTCGLPQGSQDLPGESALPRALSPFHLLGTLLPCEAMSGTASNPLRSVRMSKKRDRWDFWVDLIIPIGAVLVFIFSISTIFIGRHHGGTTARAPHQQTR